jgi:nicotinamidase-related amidase
MAKEALLICDMLNDFVREGASLEVPDTRRAIPAIRREIEMARKEGRPVVYVCEGHRPDDREFSKFGWPAHGVRGTEGARVIDELKPREADPIVYKPTYSGFNQTTLHETLKGLGVDSIRITGCVTHICIMFTAYEAVMLDYNVTVIEKGIAGLSREDHDAGLRIMKNVLGVKIV